MILWVFYVKEIERFERDNKVKVICEDENIYITGMSEDTDIQTASRTLENICNVKYTTRFLEKSNNREYEMFTPYIEIISNQDYSKLR